MRFFAIFLLAVTIPVEALAVEYSVFNLSAEWNATFDQPEIVRGWYAHSINNSGQIAGTAETVDNSVFALTWDATNGVRDFPDMEGASWTGTINNFGQIALYGNSGAFLWSENSAPQQINGWGSGPLSLTGVNDLGQVVGGHWPDGMPTAFFWNGGIAQEIGNLGGETSQAYAINNLGQVVGISELADGTSQAFLWDSVNGTSDLGTPGLSSIASDINDLGQIVGRSEIESGQSHAVLWQDGQMMDLDTLGGEFSDSTAINNLGQVIGFVRMLPEEDDPLYPHGGEHFPFIWDSVNGMQDLNDLLPSESDWRISQVYDINDNGWIVASAFNGSSSKYQIVLLKTVPEPTVTTMLITSILACGLVSFRNQNRTVS